MITFDCFRDYASVPLAAFFTEISQKHKPEKKYPAPVFTKFKILFFNSKNNTLHK